MQIPKEPIWVDNAGELVSLCERWSAQGAIAVDTEFMRSDTFYPIAGLIQIGDGNGCYLIDPLAIEDLSSLAELLANEQVVKVLHACSEDLEVFNTLLGVVPTPLFDTQLAAAFAGYGFSLGYAALLREMLGVEIPKGETRSDWLARPLSLAQKEYAALDVAHLLVVYGKLLQTLKQKQRLGWVKDDCAQMVASALTPEDLGEAYTKVGLGWKLKGQNLAALKLLSNWRELEARARNVPRNRLIKEQPLFEIARRMPVNVSGLQRIDGLAKRCLHEDGDTLLALLDEARSYTPEQCPPPLPAPLGREFGTVIKAMKACVKDQADSKEVPAEVLIRKKEYEHIIRLAMAGELSLPGRLQGWRSQVIGDGLLATVNEHLSVR